MSVDDHERAPNAESSQSANLRDWLHRRGGQVHTSLELCGTRDDGERGVFALQPIEAGELLLRLTLGCIMCGCEDPVSSTNHGKNTVVATIEAAAEHRFAPAVRAALQLLLEHRQGKSSDWSPYLATLPEHFGCLEQWSPEELKMLKGTALHDRLQSMCNPRCLSLALTLP